MSTVNVKQFQEMIKFTIEAKIKKINLPLFIWGNHGVGKTTIVTEVAEQQGYTCVPLNLANQSPEELLGLPNLNKENESVEYFKPEWLKNDDNKPRLFFIDEINRAPKYVLQAIFSFINEGRLHTHFINDDDVIIAAGNPANMNYDVTEFDDEAFISRFVHLYLEPTNQEVLQYFEQQNVHPCVVEMMKEDVDIFTNSVVKESDRLSIKPDNRMLEKVGHVLNLFEEQKKEAKDFGTELIGGMIGVQKASILMDKFFNHSWIPNPKDLFDNKLNLKQDLPHKRIDIINVFNTKLVKYMDKENIFTTTNKKFLGSLKKYIKYIPKDCALGFLHETKIINVDLIDVINLFKRVDITFMKDIIES